MHTTAPMPEARPRRTGAALLLQMATTVLALWVGARGGSPMIQAAAIAAGTLAMGLLLVRQAAYPRWAFLGAAGILALSALLSPIASGDPAAWRVNVTPMLWMYPWWPMVMGWVPARSGSAWCSPTAPGAGWMLIGAALLFAVISLGSAWLAI